MIQLPAHLTESDLAAIERAHMGTPPNAAEWAIYFRKREEEREEKRRMKRNWWE